MKQYLIARFMRPIWGPSGGRQDPGGPHFGPMILSIRDDMRCMSFYIVIRSATVVLDMISTYFFNESCGANIAIYMHLLSPFIITCACRLEKQVYHETRCVCLPCCPSVKWGIHSTILLHESRRPVTKSIACRQQQFSPHTYLSSSREDLFDLYDDL